MSAGDEETLKAYIDESPWNTLPALKRICWKWRKAGSDINVERVNKVFRAAHSIKGGCRFHRS